MPIMTVSVSEQSWEYLHQKKEGKRYGIGKFLDAVLAAEQARESVRETLERAQLVSRAEWDATGLCVD